VLIGLGYSIFSSRFFRVQTTPQSPGLGTAGPVATRTQQPITLSECAEDATLHVRRGPGTQYETIGGLVSGSCFTILGRNEDATWVYMISDDYQAGWVSASILTEVGNLSRVSVRDFSPMADSSQATLTSVEIAHGAQVYLTEVAATILPQSTESRHVIPCFETADRIGDHISCRLEKAYCNDLPATTDSPKSCYDRPYPDHIFTLILSAEDWNDYDGQCIIVSGYLEISRGTLQIQALRRSQVSPCS
jgi:hypothetical protein